MKPTLKASDPDSSSEPIAVIGMACMFPKSPDLQAYWRLLKDGVDAITEVPASHWRPEDYFDSDPKRRDHTYSRRGGFLPPFDFDPLEYGIAPNALEATDTSQLLAMVVAKQALEDAGYGATRPFDREKVSVLLGVTGALELVIPLGARLGFPKWARALEEAGVEAGVIEDVMGRISESYVDWQEASFPGLLGNVVAGRIANFLDLHGTNAVVDAACASSLSALHLALLELRSGHCDLALSGGVDTFNDIFMYMCFSKTPALSRTGDAKPFDDQADGTIIGEGLGVMVLKRLSDAERDGDRIYALIRDMGSSSDGKGNAIYAPSASGQRRALEQAYALAGVSPRTVELLEGHGTGTIVGDAAEIKALEETFRMAEGEGTWCALGSVKSQIGHTKAAAGVAGLIKAILALHHRVIPPTIKVTRPNAAVAPKQTPFYVNSNKRPWIGNPRHPRRAGVSSFGFGGSNFHCVLEEYPGGAPEIDWDEAQQLIAFSSESIEGLLARIRQWEGRVMEEAELAVEFAAARVAFRAEHPFRLLLVPEAGKSWRDLARQALDQLGKSTSSSWESPQGIYFGTGARPEKLGILFPGQGSQYVGMLRDLACAFPQMGRVLEAADRLFADMGSGPTGRRLSDSIYPHPAFEEGEQQSQEAELRDTRNAQPAIGAVSLGAWEVLKYFGVQAQAVAGHSYGELTALCAAGNLSPDDFLRLSIQRGVLMAQGGNGRGGMLAVQATEEQVQEILQKEKLHLVIANKNAPQQMVLSGFSEDIARAATVLEGMGIRHSTLPVSGAFHSSLVTQFQKALAMILGETPWSAGEIPVYANSTGEAYPRGAQAGRELLGRQLERPVEFIREIRAMAEAGIQTFLEVGPGSRLRGLISEILKDRPHVAFALDAGSGSGAGQRNGMLDLARCIAKLASLAYPVQLERWCPAAPKFETGQKRPSFTVSICGANYRSPKKSETAVPVPSPVIKREEKISSLPPAPSSESFRLWQENLKALQSMQEKTAELHKQFLEGQESIHQTLRELLSQERASLQGTSPAVFESGPLRTQAVPIVEVEKTIPAPSVSVPSTANAPEPPSPEPTGAGLYSESKIREVVLQTISEKTGYPVEMLDLGMGMDSELGIDSIKRVEILSQVQEALPQAPEIGPDQLGTLKTLGQIIAYLASGKDSSSSPSQGLPKKPSPPPVSSEQRPFSLERSLLQAKDYHPDSSRRRLNWESGAELWILNDGDDLAKALVKKFQQEGYRPRSISFSANELPKPPEVLAGLLIVSPPGYFSKQLIRRGFEILQAAASPLKQAASGRDPVVVGIARMDGAFGLLPGPKDFFPWAGAWAGLVKTALQEWPELRGRAFDVDQNWEDGEEAARQLFDEILAEGPLELGLSSRGVVQTHLVQQDLPSESVPGFFGPEDVLLITGGGRGVTAETALALAQVFHPTLILLGRSPEPSPEAPWLQDLQEEGEIKQALLEQVGSKKCSPSQLEAQYRQCMANREILRTLERIQAAGSPAHYRSVDVRDKKRVTEVLGELRAELGPISGFIHGAGVLADKKIEEKTWEQFESVWSTKVEGMQHLLDALQPDPLKAWVLFSSTTARWGRRGQVDYAMANEALNKTAQVEAARRPGCRVLAVNWGPWEGGMVGEGLKKIFRQEGVGMIPLHAGSEYLAREIQSGPTDAVEIVVSAGTPKALSKEESPAALNLALERTLDLSQHPYLSSHIIGGHAVLPFAMMAEYLAYGTLCQNPGLQFIGFENLRLLNGVIFDGEESQTIGIYTGKIRKRGAEYLVAGELMGRQDSPDRKIHARGEVLLAEGYPPPAASNPGMANPSFHAYPHEFQEIYHQILFHGPQMQCIQRVEGFSDAGISAWIKPSPSPAEWSEQPLQKSWISFPWLLDAAFQLLILWSFERHQAQSLPVFISTYRQFHKALPQGPVRVLASVADHGEHLVRADIEFFDEQGALLSRMEGYECVVDASLNQAFRLNHLPLKWANGGMRHETQ